MSALQSSPLKRNPNHKHTLSTMNSKLFPEDNNNMCAKNTQRLQARSFVSWYQRMIDEDRPNLGLYLSDNATLEWFGRTIRTRKKVAAFLKYDMQCSSHDFTTVDCVDGLQTRQDRIARSILPHEDSPIANPLHSPEIIKGSSQNRKRPGLRSTCSSPEWDPNCRPPDECENKKNAKKIRLGKDSVKNSFDNEKISMSAEHLLCNEGGAEINNKGDYLLPRRSKRKCVLITPPNQEVGQGDGLPSTSGTDPVETAKNFNIQLTKKYIECNGFIGFTRSRNNNRNSDVMKWERKCKVQIAYSEDPLNVGEYIIWAIHYTDDSKCRRNLLAAFEEVAKDEELKNK